MENENYYIDLWKKYQELIEKFSDQSWKIRSVNITVWTGLVAYSFQNGNHILYVLLIPVNIFFLLMETGPKILERKYILKSLEIEKSISNHLQYGKNTSADIEFTTNVYKFTLKDYLEIFSFKRWQFWLPYFCMMLINTLLFLFKFVSI